MAELVVFNVRVKPELEERIQARMKKVGISSRNQWVTMALEWALEQPIRVEQHSVRT